MRSLFFPALICSFFAYASHAADPPARRLGLSDCVDIALRNNFGLAVRRLEVLSTIDDVKIARAAFEPEFFASAGHNFRAGAVPADDVTLSEYSTGVVTRVPTGATVQLDSNLTRTDVGFRRETFDSGFDVTLRQPLLKGGGLRINLLPIRLGKLNVGQEKMDLRRSMLDLVGNLELAWWALVFAHRDKELAERTVALSERLLEEAGARVRVGLATKVEILQANTALVSRREAVISARQAIADRRDDLLLLMGKLGKAQYSFALPSGNPPITPRTISDREALRLVRELPEFHIQLANIHQRELLVDEARNDKLPALDLLAGGGVRGFGFSTGEAFDRNFGDPRADWLVGLELRIPLGFRAERAQVRQAKNSLEIERLRQSELEQVLHAQLREAERAVILGAERTIVTEALVRLSDRQFDQLLARFKEGLTTFREMQLAQEDVNEARLRALAAQLEAIRATIRRARLDGTLLSRYALAWKDAR